MKIKNIKKINSTSAAKNYNPKRVGIRRARESSLSYENIVIATDADVD